MDVSRKKPSSNEGRVTPISVFLFGTDSCAFMYNPPHSAYDDDAITAFINSANMNIGPLESSLYFCLNKNSQLP